MLNTLLNLKNEYLNICNIWIEDYKEIGTHNQLLCALMEAKKTEEEIKKIKDELEKEKTQGGKEKDD